jgi:hypothetical protein
MTIVSPRCKLPLGFKNLLNPPVVKRTFPSAVIGIRVAAAQSETFKLNTIV